VVSNGFAQRHFLLQRLVGVMDHDRKLAIRWKNCGQTNGASVSTMMMLVITAFMEIPFAVVKNPDLRSLVQSGSASVEGRRKT
jgi:hypothetical protein